MSRKMHKPTTPRMTDCRSKPPLSKWMVLFLAVGFASHQTPTSSCWLASAFQFRQLQNTKSRWSSAWRSTATRETEEKQSFETMTRFDDRLAVLEEEAPYFLTDYYEPSLKSFSIAPGSNNQTLSVTSTVCGLLALEEYPSLPLACRVRNEREEQILALIQSGWRENDLYDISSLVSVLLKLDPSLQVVEALIRQEDDSSVATRMATLLEKVVSGRTRRRLGEEQLFSAYINYLCTKVYVDLSEIVNRDPKTNALRLGALPLECLQQVDQEHFVQEITIAVSRSAETAKDELCRQLAYRSAGDSERFDVIKLVYNLLCYVKATESLKGNTLLSPRASSQDEAIQLAVPKLNRKLVAAALAVFFDEQDDSNGLWDRGQPIYKSFQRKGRNVGNAYVFGIDALGSVLEVLGTDAEVFRPYLPNLEQALGWIERNIDMETSVIAEECNTDTGRCYGKALRGWSSPHLSSSSGPNAWSTAQTVICLGKMRRIVKELLHNDVLEEFGGISISSRTNLDQNAAWDRLLDSDLGGGTPDCRTIKSVLEERVVAPFVDASNVNDPGVGAAYSTILFGSPGTAKTTITEAVAEKLGWDFVVIDTTAFLADGLTNVASRIRYVFSRLRALRRCVILFDEIEEFCLDRETPGISMESRMLTTAMLTAINDLRRTKQSVFFLATNRLRAFDAAIIRPGRFDMQLFVGTPNLEARVKLLEQALPSSLSSEEDEREQIIKTYKEFLRSVWTQDAMFMNYLEGKQYASRVASIVEGAKKAGGPSVLEEEELERILSQQAAVMTARGSVRDEYIAQMGLSRL